MKKWKCESCGHLFNDREAKCENWQIKEISFICPSCDARLERVKEGARDTIIFSLQVVGIFVFPMLTPKNANYAVQAFFSVTWLGLLILLAYHRGRLSVLKPRPEHGRTRVLSTSSEKI